MFSPFKKDKPPEPRLDEELAKVAPAVPAPPQLYQLSIVTELETFRMAPVSLILAKLNAMQVSRNGIFIQIGEEFKLIPPHRIYEINIEPVNP